MESRFQHIFLVVLWLAALPLMTPSAIAKSISEAVDENTIVDQSAITKIERREVLEDLLDSENFEIGVQLGVLAIEDFESNLWISGQLTYHINEYFYAKALYGNAKAGETSFERLSNVPPLLTNKQRKLEYYGLNIGYNLLPGEVFISKTLAFNSLFSIELGGGSTDFAGDSQFTVNLSANYRLFLTDWLTWDIAMTDYIFDTSITGERKTTHNLNFTTGVAFYF